MASTTVNLFSQVPLAVEDEAFQLTAVFNADSSPDKVNLGAGVYKDDQGRSWKLPAIAKAEKLLFESSSISYDYLPITGNGEFVKAARQTVFGPLTEKLQGRIASVQTVSGTGANHVGARFLVDNLPAVPSSQRPRKVWISDPTWGNHHLIWKMVSEESKPVDEATYKYYNPSTRTLDFEGMIADLEEGAVEGDVLLLHACAHNPTGLDPSNEQWLSIAALCKRKGLFPFFDSAYQGFASGDLDLDAWALRQFASMGMEICVAQSFSKSLGMYGQRAGAFHLVCHDPESAKNSLSQLATIQRAEISTPPAFGAQIVTLVLNDESLFKQWGEDLTVMSGRIKSMRHSLYSELKELQTPGTWEHIINQNGMFSYTGLTESEVESLMLESHIYMMRSGRVSIAGLNSSNVSYVAKCINEVVKSRRDALASHL